jgi:hypothetical protein
MIVALYIYVDGIAKRIELFDDEKISVTSSIQNINDISKVFTDYSQSFTIPASDNNNEIFKHWYENSLDNGFDQRIRFDGYIEIDTQTFRVGKWQLESASIKNNRVEDYKITFYGNLKSLTDKFGEDKLKDLNTLNDYTIAYSGSNVESSIKSNIAENVMFPLISSNRVWQYGSGGLQDISLNANRINFNELFPAIKVERIFDAIQTKYNVNFNGVFLNDDRFTNAYLWLKNSEQKFLTPLTTTKTIELNNYISDWYQTENNIININFSPFSSSFFDSDFKIKITINFPSILNSKLLIYKNGFLYTTILRNSNSTSIELDYSNGSGYYQFIIQTNIFTSYSYNYTTSYYSSDPSSSGFIEIENVNNTGDLELNLDLTALAPDMKVSDFFSGILKMFNLIAFSDDGINFTIEQLENWYYLGSIKDFSGYTTTDAEFTRVKPYKKINFEYEKSESVLNKNFSDTNSREFGNLSYTFNNDGSDYSIKLPFENILFNKFTSTNLQVGYALKTDLTPYTPKAIILYRYEKASCSFYFYNGTTSPIITNYNVFGQDVKYQSQNHSLNWGVEISSYLLNLVNNSLFNNYYLAYLNNLYSLKSRMLKVKMRLPYSELLDLKLNDRIVIRDKRYIINQLTTDLTTFESDFELIEDFRTINFNNSGIIRTDNASKTLIYKTTSIDQLKWDDKSDVNFMIVGVESFLDRVEIQIRPNISGIQVNAIIQSNLNDELIIIQDA